MPFTPEERAEAKARLEGLTTPELVEVVAFLRVEREAATDAHRLAAATLALRADRFDCGDPACPLCILRRNTVPVQSTP